MPKLNKKTFSPLSIVNTILIITLALIVSMIGFNNYYCKVEFLALSQEGKSPVFDKDKINPGYTLLTPLSQNSQTNGNNPIYLMDLYGRTVHQWNAEFSAFYAVLKPNGNLLVALISPVDTKNYPSGGRTGIIQELDWNSKVVWEYKHEMLHHDFDILPNGNIAVTLWQQTPKNVAARVKGGAIGSEFKGEMYDDMIVELDRKGEVKWSWNAYEHLDGALDGLNPQAPRATWTNINGLKYMAKNPINGQEGYLASLRANSEVIMIDKASGDIIWRSPKGLLGGQHDPTLLENGNVMVFNNNIYQAFSNPPSGSSLMEINPQTNEVVWQLGNGAYGVEHSKFYSFLVGGGQRLPNGNTLVVDGHHGHLFEVTPEKKLVWDFINPYSNEATGLFPNNTIFKARKYGNEINWPEKLPDSLPIMGDVCDRLGKIF